MKNRAISFVTILADLLAKNPLDQSTSISIPELEMGEPASENQMEEWGWTPAMKEQGRERIRKFQAIELALTRIQEMEHLPCKITAWLKDNQGIIKSGFSSEDRLSIKEEELWDPKKWVLSYFEECDDETGWSCNVSWCYDEIIVYVNRKTCEVTGWQQG